MYASLCEFGGLRWQWNRLVILLVTAAPALTWTTFIHDDYQARILIMSSTLIVLFAACGLVISRAHHLGFAERFIRSVFIATSIVTLIRCISAFFQDSGLTMNADMSLIHSVYIRTFAFSLVALGVEFMLMVIRAMQIKLESMATQDQMTGMYRRDAFLALLDRNLMEAKRTQRPMSLLIIDLDNFKHITDRHGHPKGDKVIIDFH